jgi:hypothetical protein
MKNFYLVIQLNYGIIYIIICYVSDFFYTEVRWIACVAIVVFGAGGAHTKRKNELFLTLCCVTYNFIHTS